MNSAQTNTPATINELESVLGSIDRKALMEIRRIGPSLSEVKEVQKFMASEEYMGEVLERTLNPRPRRVYAVLKQFRCTGVNQCCCS
jgi:hypothetical protein